MMMVSLSKGVVSHRWNVLLAMQSSEMRQQQMRARSPLGPPRLQHTTSSCLHTCSMIAGVSVSAPSMRREKWSRRQAMTHLSVGLSRSKAASRLVRLTKSLRYMLRKKRSLCLVLC